MQTSQPSLTEEMRYFALDGLFPKNCVLVYHKDLGILSLLACVRQEARLLAQQRFVGREQDILLALLTSWPQMAPYEILHASYYQGFARLSESTLLQTKQRLDGSRSGEGWKTEIKNLRQVMAAVRLRLLAFGLDAICLQGSGYILDQGKEMWRNPLIEDSHHQAQLQLVSHS